MTSHRASDLSYGQLGEATYDTEERTWSFLRGVEDGRVIQPLRALQRYIPASLFIQESEDPSVVAKEKRRRERWLDEKLGSTHALTGLLATLSKIVAPRLPPSSTLLAVGKASDTNHLSGSRAFPIIALPHGPAGNVLRLIRPRIGQLGWEGGNHTNLKTLDLSSCEDAFWIGPGGPIHQISFATSTEGSTRYVVVRKAESITILRPVYSQVPVPTICSPGFVNDFPASRLSASPVIHMEMSETGTSPYADVTFNPWYTRQFAVLDEQGFWTIWDIESQQRTKKAFKITPGKSGHVKGSTDAESAATIENEADGWGRILWAGDVSTIVLCNRRGLAVFDLKGDGARSLTSPDLLKSTSTDWILDVKRHPINFNQIIVLTTSQVFWLKITSNGEDTPNSGANIILSQRHFRDHEDASLSVEVAVEGEACIVLVYSSLNALVTQVRLYYNDITMTPSSCLELLSLPEQDTTHQSSRQGIQTLSVLPALVIPKSRSTATSSSDDCVENEVAFFQLLCLGTDHSLSETISAITSEDTRSSTATQPVYRAIDNPTVKTRQPFTALSSARNVNNFFADDDTVKEELASAIIVQPRRQYGRHDSAFAESFDAQEIFELAFPSVVVNNSLPGTNTTISAGLNNLLEEIKAMTLKGIQGTSTALELVDFVSFKEDIDEASIALRRILDEVRMQDDIESALTLDLLWTPFLPNYGSALAVNDHLPSLSNIYDRMVQAWVTCLPIETFGSARLAKEKLVRSAAVELCLSSLILSLKSKSSRLLAVTSPIDSQETMTTYGKLSNDRGHLRSSTQIDHFSTSQSSQTAFHRLPTPATTATQSSIWGSTISSITGQDDAVSYLRNYAKSIKAQRPAGSGLTNVLAHWDLAEDPWAYSWDSVQKSVAGARQIDSDDEEAHAERKEAHRRQRRAERYLKKQRQSLGASSQPLVGTPLRTLPIHTAAARSQPQTSGWDIGGSQPDSRAMFSSPAKGEISMTQPISGAFGSRLGNPASTAKRRRTKGF